MAEAVVSPQPDGGVVAVAAVAVVAVPGGQEGHHKELRRARLQNRYIKRGCEIFPPREVSSTVEMCRKLQNRLEEHFRKKVRIKTCVQYIDTDEGIDNRLYVDV